MHFMNEDIFSTPELNWLEQHPETEEQINESLEDSLNTNPLDSGEPDLGPYNEACAAAHITIEAAMKKLIEGPYNNDHFQMIFRHITDVNSNKDHEKTFWQLFNYHCASFSEEDETWPKERVYIEAMKEMIRMMNESSLELYGNSNNQVANLNTGTIQQIKGKGVNAKIVD